jgi:hypothetical protein
MLSTSLLRVPNARPPKNRVINARQARIKDPRETSAEAVV